MEANGKDRRAAENELAEARKTIDRIDREMRKLFCERMQTADRIGQIKTSLSLPIVQKTREKEILAEGKKDLPDGMAADWETYQRNIMAISRERQARFAEPLRFPGYGVNAYRGAIATLPEYASDYPNVCLIFDGGIPAKLRTSVKKLLPTAYSITLKGGETVKSNRSFVSLLEKLTSLGIGRDGLLVGIGGGALLDLVGFTAGVFRRGVDFLSVPTTLLADVDASVGGKNAIDFSGIKNQIGLIRRPIGVIADPNFLSSLPERQMRAGLAEIIKIAAIADKDLFETLETEGLTSENAERIIFRAISLKKHFVEEDEADRGVRRALNFGHTVGHAIEAAADGKYLHGEAVALGMLPMCSKEVGARLSALLARSGLPIDCRLAFSELEVKIRQDKKATEGGVVAVLCDKIGSYSLSKLTVEEIECRYNAAF